MIHKMVSMKRSGVRYPKRRRGLYGKWITFALILPFALIHDLRSAQYTDAFIRDPHSEFGVKYVSADAVYLDGGSEAGLTEGQKLVIRRKGAEDAIVAQIEIESVTSSSSVGTILSGSGAITPGDIACLQEKQKSSSNSAGEYPQIIGFTEDNPLDQEVRENLPKPPLPEINRTRGRIGFDVGYMQQPDIASSLYGLTFQIDASRLGGSYWNLRGYYRGYRRSEKGNTIEPTIVDLVNRTYHLSLSYDNPKSGWVAGAGRLFVPWASSLDTLDGFYLGRRFGKATAGIFGGSAPDPTSWDYDPHRQMAGSFVNFEAGGFDSLRFSSTSGIALTRIRWRPNRQFGFFQNGLFYKRYLSIYSDMQYDLLSDSERTQSPARRRLELSRSYLTIRLQPLRAISFDVSENYFRNIPTFDERLLGIGLLDKYLFQGLSGGFHLDLPYKLGIYSTVGRSSRSGDAKPSWDYLTGATAGNILHSGVRADLRYSRFNSSFGSGTYRSFMLSRDIGESLQFDVQVGQQDVLSAFTSQNRSRFINGNLSWFFETHYYFGVGTAVYRGNTENYRQLFATLGYRFDNRRQRRQ
jgi:hypothetical protein